MWISETWKHLILSFLEKNILIDQSKMSCLDLDFPEFYILYSLFDEYILKGKSPT